jgi:hypothetical protein
VTTVDVYFRSTDGRSSVSLHNGLFGPATDVLHALIRAFQSGAVSGPWHSSYIDTTVKGTIVRSILAGVDELDPTYHRPGDWARFAEFRDAIEDDADYAVKAIEV